MRKSMGVVLEEIKKNTNQVIRAVEGRADEKTAAEKPNI
jgi:hypothetical protein